VKTIQFTNRQIVDPSSGLTRYQPS